MDAPSVQWLSLISIPENPSSLAPCISFDQVPTITHQTCMHAWMDGCMDGWMDATNLYVYIYIYITWVGKYRFILQKCIYTANIYGSKIPIPSPPSCCTSHRMNHVFLHLPGTARRQRRGPAGSTRPPLAGPPAVDGQQDDGHDVHGDEAGDLRCGWDRTIEYMYDIDERCTDDPGTSKIFLIRCNILFR